MNRICTTLWVVFLACSLQAQEIISPAAKSNFCQPGVCNQSPSRGVAIEYGVAPSISFRDDDGDYLTTVRQVENLRLKLKAPLILKEGFKMVVGWSHSREYYDFRQIQGEQSFLETINSNTLKNNSFGLYGLKPFRGNRYLTFKSNFSFNGDYQKLVDFDPAYFTMSVGALYGMKKDDFTEWGIGGGFSHGARGLRVIAFLMYNHTFNSKWGIESVIPSHINLRYNISPDHVLIVGPAFSSRTYTVSVNDSEVTGPLAGFNNYAFGRNELNLKADYMHRISGWIWASFQMGLTKNFGIEFQPTDFEELRTLRVNPGNGYYFRVGIFVSPNK